MSDQRSAPDAMRLYATHMTTTALFIPKMKWIEKGIASKDVPWPFVKGSKHETERNQCASLVHRVCPIPPFLVLDGFDRDIDIGVMYRRLQGVDDQDSAWVKHAFKFVKACMLQPKGMTAGTSLPASVFAERKGAEITQWSQQRIHQLCPTLTNTTTTNHVSPSPPLPDIIAQLLASQATAAANLAAQPAAKRRNNHPLQASLEWHRRN